MKDSGFRLVPVADANNMAHSTVILTVGTSSIGRATHNHIVLDDEQVSKRHARITVDDGVVTIEDVGSSNGTVVNGESVEVAQLTPGDVIELGGCRFELSAGGGAPARVTMVPGAEATRVFSARPMENFATGVRIHGEDKLLREYERLRVAWSAVQELSAGSEPTEVCKRVVDTVLELVRAESAVALLRGAQGKLNPIAASSRHGGATRMVVSRAILERVVETREAVLASDALNDERFDPTASMILSSARSIMAVPLLRGEQLLGVLHATSPDTAAFGDRDLELLAGLGSGAAVALANIVLNRRLDAEARTRSALERFLSPALVEQVMHRRVNLLRGGVDAEVTVLFADIRGFTSVTERSDAASVVALLNEYFEQMVEVVFANQGVLDKLIGDALMAVWGTPVRRDDDAARALASARGLHLALAQLNEARRARGEAALAIGVGVATGMCVAGAMGARRRMDYTVIGDAVNLASRLAGIARGGEVVCDEPTFRKAGAPEDAELQPPTQVKGKAVPVRVYRIRVG